MIVRVAGVGGADEAGSMVRGGGGRRSVIAEKMSRMCWKSVSGSNRGGIVSRGKR